MSNIPGASGVLPGVFTDVITQSRGVSVPGGSRIAAMIGEGSTDETITPQASGGGNDGLNSAYASITGRDGRHFQLKNAPLITNRTTLFKNGIPLVGLESIIDSNPFDNKFDYRVDIATGRVELQAAHLTDQGGSFYSQLSSNSNPLDGYLNNLTLLDVNSPPENWTIRCVSVQRNGLAQPISGTAKFLAFGSVSGAKLDANSNPVVWVDNNNVVNNGILSFSLGSNYNKTFKEGDAFTVKVSSGVLVRNDSLVANYIPFVNLNDPALLQGLGPVAARHGFPSVNNNLSLGAQLAFANSAPALLTVQAAPAMPRRTSHFLNASVDSMSLDDNEFIFPLPFGVTPDFNSNVHFFVTNNATNVETQILPNKLDFYTLGTSGDVHNFISDSSTHSYFYTITKGDLEVLNTAADGYMGRYPTVNNDGYYNRGVFSSASVTFNSSYVGKVLKIVESKNSANFGYFKVNAVSGGKLYVEADGYAVDSLTMNPTHLSDFANQTSVAFAVTNFLSGLPVLNGSSTDGDLVHSFGLGTGKATFKSNNIDFSSILNITDHKLQINGSSAIQPVPSPQPGNNDWDNDFEVNNDGLYEIISSDGYVVDGYQITISKAVVSESNLEFEVLDTNPLPANTTSYVVVNHNVVPSGYALRVTLIDTRDAAFFDAGWINALKALEKVECDIVVPLPKQTISIIFQNTLNHCKTMSNIRNKKERVLFTGAISGLTPENLTGVKPAAVEDIGILEGIQGDSITDILSGNIEDLSNYSIADAFGNTYRCVYFYPDQIVVQAGGDNVLIDGFYIAAAAAGYESADIRLENPMTNKVLGGFTILRDKQFSPLTLEQLANAGATTLQPVAGGGRIVWGRTTTQSGFPEEEEISIVFIRDRVAKTLRAGFQGFIGTAETPDTEAILNTRGVILLNSLVSQGLITQFRDLSVKRDGVDPRQWNVTVRVQPTYPINFIYIKVSLGQV